MRGKFNRARHGVKTAFSPKKIIVVSDKQVKHLRISGRAQTLGLLAIVTLLTSGSYLAGAYLHSSNKVEQQAEMLQAVTEGVVQANFDPNAFSSLRAEALPGTSQMMDLQNPVTSLGSMSDEKLIARLAFLEGRVTQLKKANENIVKVVREKTGDTINALQSAIKLTGLEPESLKKEMKKREPKGIKGGQGGPYIPLAAEEMEGMSDELYNQLDEVVLLKRVLTSLPTGMPMINGAEQSGFGRRIDPIRGTLAMHEGLDYSGVSGTKIVASAEGRVLEAGMDGAFGNMVTLDHGFGVTSRYAHMSRILVQDGQTVSKGDVLGIQGSTGRVTGPHVHFEVRYNGKPLNPKNFIMAGKYVP